MAPNAETQQSDSEKGEQFGAKEGGPYSWYNQIPALNSFISREFINHSTEIQKQAAI